MNYYLDFEATQFSKKRIISIGCVNDNEESFYTLVKPIHDGKINDFITNLTGITQEDLNSAPDAETAFSALRDFIRSTNTNQEETFFFCFGNGDSDFINHTVKYIDNLEIRNFGECLSESLIDFSAYARYYFHASSVSLCKIINYFNKEERIEQKHNALEDARWLQIIAKAIIGTTPMEKSPWPEVESNNIKKVDPYAKTIKKHKVSKSKKKKTYVGKIICEPSPKILIHSPKTKAKVYNSLEQAVMAVYNKCDAKANKENIKKKIIHAINCNEAYRNRLWKIKKEG